MKEKRVALPYINNISAVLITVVINLVIVFFVSWPGGMSFLAVMIETACCAVITVVVNMILVYRKMKMIRNTGDMPTEVPLSNLMQRLPKNPFALSAVCFVGFAVIMVAINALILSAFGMQYLDFWPWVAYKIIYTTLLSIKITEFIIFRYVQPDWANTGDTIQGAKEDGQKEGKEGTVKNPLPKFSIFSEMFGSVATNAVINLLLGLATGSVIIGADQSVFINPTTIEAIPITGVVFGIITGVLVTNISMKTANATLLSQDKQTFAGIEKAPSDKRFSWMPKRKVSMTIVICILMMILSAVILWSVMALFEIEVMNFYQFVVFVTVYAAIMSKPLQYIIVKRCSQPDYITRLLAKTEAKKKRKAS